MAKRLQSAAEIDAAIEKLVQQKEKIIAKRQDRFSKKLLTKDIRKKISEMDEAEIDKMAELIKQYWDEFYKRAVSDTTTAEASDQ